MVDATTMDPMAAALQASPSFVNPAYITPEQVAMLRGQAQQLMKPPEVHNWAQALGQIAQTGAGWSLANRASALEQARGASANAAAAAGGDGGAQPSMGGGAGGPVASASIPPASGGSGGPASDLASFYAPKLGPAAAAGLVGGFGAENAGFDPTVQGDNKHAIGLAQWNDRRPTLEAYAAKHGVSPTDANVQKQFSLVEMGLAGSPSDPGYGTERKAGNALQAAKTPQEATAAALMYERPGGYTPQHPENANGYAKRLALASALMGTQGGAPGPQAAGNGPMAYAPGQGSPQGGTGVPWPAQRPQAAPQAGGQPAAVQMAQNAQPGSGAPLMGMSRQQYADFITNQGIPEKIRERITEGQFPQPMPLPGGGTAFQAPLQPVPRGGPPVAAQGVLQGTAAAPGASASTFTGVGTQGPQGTQLGLPQGQGGGGGLGALDPLAAKGREFGAQTQDQEMLVHQLGTIREQGPSSKASLGQIGTLQQLGDKVGSGALPMIQSWAAQHGVALGKDVSDIQAYEAMAKSMVPGMRPPGSGSLGPDISLFSNSIGNLATTTEGRHIIANNLRMLHQYNAQQAEIASDFTKPPQQRWAEIQALPIPKPVTALPEKQGASAGAGGAPVAVATPEEARKYPSGTKIKLPDGRMGVVP